MRARDLSFVLGASLLTAVALAGGAALGWTFSRRRRSNWPYQQAAKKL